MLRSSYTLPAILRRRMEKVIARMEKRGIPRPNWSRVICLALEREVTRLEKECKERT